MTTTKTKWSRKVPQEEGWYWIKYCGKNGMITVPCQVTHFRIHKDWVISTARNDSFYSHTALPKEVRFGPRIEEP